MTFTEKLRQLTEGKNRTAISKSAGLSPTAVNDYLQRGYVPRADNALSLARVLQVPVEWLIDDEREYPPPTSTPFGVGQLDNETLMLEVARRYRLDVLDFFKQIDRATRADMKKLLAEVKAWGEGHKPSTDAIMVSTLWFQWVQLLRRWTVQSFADEHHAQLPGSSLPVEDFDLSAIEKRFDAVAGGGMFQAMQTALIGLLGESGIDELARTQHRRKPLDASTLPK